MTVQKYSAKESLNRILRLFGDGIVPSTDAPETVPGEVYSENESLSRLAELLGKSLDGSTLTIPDSLNDAIRAALSTVTILSVNTVLSTDHTVVIATQPITITLPTAIGFYWEYAITNNSSGRVTVLGNASELIGKRNRLIISKRYSTAVIYSDGTGWYYK